GRRPRRRALRARADRHLARPRRGPRRDGGLRARRVPRRPLRDRRRPRAAAAARGAGPLEAELRAAAPEGVTRLGRVSPVAEVYERNAVVVAASRGEGFGMVAL